MEQRNGYFQIEVADDDILCHVHPPVEGGAPINIKESEDFLEAQGFSDYDKRKFRENIVSSRPITFSLGISVGLDFTETMMIRLSLDKMKAFCRFYPPSFGGNLLDSKDILAQLASKNVTFGIDQDAILDFLDHRCYATDYVFAEGKPPVIGHDAKIEYFFNINPDLKPHHNEDGSVDYRELNTISSVSEGDLLARLTPADPGENGKDVTGREIPTRKVKNARLEFGKNIAPNEDRTEIYSQVTGHAVLVNDEVRVSDVYEIEGDVDNSVGNVNYVGNVHIQGSVRSGFHVYAEGDVVIEGVVEGAVVEAKGQIIVKCGIHGMQTGVLRAKGNVITQFIENAKVFSGGYVETGSIIYSEVNASDDVIVNDHKGFISGGVIRAGGKVESQTIGSSMGAFTRIEVGMAPDRKKRYAVLQKEINQVSAEINKIIPILKTYQKYLQDGRQLDQKNLAYMNQLFSDLQTQKKKLQEDRVEFNALHQELLSSNHAKVVIRRDIYPGITITISDITITTKDKRSFCQFERKNGEIVVSNL